MHTGRTLPVSFSSLAGHELAAHAGFKFPMSIFSRSQSSKFIRCLRCTSLEVRLPRRVHVRRQNSSFFTQTVILSPASNPLMHGSEFWHDYLFGFDVASSRLQNPSHQVSAVCEMPAQNESCLSPASSNVTRGPQELTKKPRTSGIGLFAQFQAHRRPIGQHWRLGRRKLTSTGRRTGRHDDGHCFLQSG